MDMTPEQVHQELNAKLDVAVRELRVEIRELRAEMLEQFLQVEKRFQQMRLYIWLPVITGIVQIILQITHR
jgi:hypothetical protein